MIAVTKKISQLVYFNMEDNVFEAMPLFRKFSVKLDEQVVTVRVSEEMEYILNKLRIDTGNWLSLNSLSLQRWYPYILRLSIVS